MTSELVKLLDPAVCLGNLQLNIRSEEKPVIANYSASVCICSCREGVLRARLQDQTI